MRANIKELPAISLHGIYKNYGMGENEVVALKNINVDIAAGEFMALCGPSGSGKSTLLKLLTREEKPSSGKIVVGGIDYDTLKDKQKYECIDREKSGSNT